MSCDCRDALLEVRDLTVRFGGVVALDAVSFDVHEGQICALIGPNGAGKTTAFNAISRLRPSPVGDCRVRRGRCLAHRAASLSSLGIARTFQNLALSPGMTVLENVMVGAHRHGTVGLRCRAVRVTPAEGGPGAARAGLRSARVIRHRRSSPNEPCHGLPFGTMKRIELARAMAAGPRLLMLDEPAGGLDPGRRARAGRCRCGTCATSRA